MEVIVFEKEAYRKLLAEFNRMIKEAVKSAKDEQQTPMKEEEVWVVRSEAELILKCKKDKLKQLRDDDEIRTAKTGRKVLYFKPSLYEYLERNS